MSAPHRIPVAERSSRANRVSDSDEDAESTKSLSSASNIYRYENGRRYHTFRDGEYWAPNDQMNSYHEKIFHHLMLLTLNDRLHLAPLSHPKQVIDLGTGTGIWATDFAEHHEEAEVLGVDLSAVESPCHPNLRFIVDDISSEWTHNTKFDFVHSRSLYGSIADWPGLYKQCFDNMTSGGYIEQVEVDIEPKSDDGTLPADSILFQWNTIARDWTRATGKTFFVANEARQQIANANFVDVVERIFKIPLGTWSSDEHFKNIGRFFLQFWREGMEGWIMATATRHLGWSLERVREFLSETRKALEVPGQHVYYEIVVVYARKP